MTGSPLVGGSKFVSWHPASIERMLKTDAGILRMLILRMLGKMLGNYVTDYKTLMDENINGLLR
jgi:hypothetical protein